jgi:hypothetical protein
MHIDRITRVVFLKAAFAAIFCCAFNASSQHRLNNFLTPGDSLRQSRLYAVAGSWTAIYGTALVGLNYAWYQQYERVPFHTFNDWLEWNHMDKAGHLWTAYMETRWTAQALKWSGVKPNVADAAAAGTGLLFQTTLELLDAGSAKWGFSWSDMAANATGTMLFYAQSRLWHEQRVAVKYSFTPVRYNTYTNAQLGVIDDRVKNLYGNGLVETALKDYNGQTYWLSVNPSSFTRSFKPKWLNVAFGYGAEGMLGGRQNIWNIATASYDYTSIPRTRQFYLSPDIDFTRIPTRSPLLKTTFEILNVIKMPAPALMFDSRGALRFYPLMF